MTITLLAPDGVPVTAQQERQARAAMFGGNPARPLGGRSGFRPGTTADTLTATSTTWTLKPCALMIDPGATTAQGMYGWASDANITGSVTAADATNPRVDILYILVNDSTSGDGSGSVSASPVYLAGTAATTPSAPAVPPRGFLLGTISVPKAGGGSPTATVNPQYFVAAGGILPVSSQAERDALTQFDGREVLRLDKGGMREISMGGAWGGPVKNITPTSVSGMTTSGTITLTALGGGTFVDLNLQFVTTGTTNLSGTFVSLGAPVPAAARSDNAPTYYGATWLSGSSAGINTPANIFYNPSTGVVSLRLQSGTLTTGAGVTFNLNIRYLI